MGAAPRSAGVACLLFLLQLAPGVAALVPSGHHAARGRCDCPDPACQTAAPGAFCPVARANGGTCPAPEALAVARGAPRLRARCGCGHDAAPAFVSARECGRLTAAPPQLAPPTVHGALFPAVSARAPRSGSALDPPPPRAAPLTA
jgi:hypothetical protein